MNLFTSRLITTSALLLVSVAAFAQCFPLPVLTVQNPSFEGALQPHVTPAPWTNCQPSQTPDTQPGSWSITLPPTNGNSYLGLVHQPSANWQEGASQQLSSPMTAGVQYSFTIDLANSSSIGGGIAPGCAECQIWGSNSTCAYTELLWSSGDITPYDVWQTYNVVFTPTQNWQFITIYINGLGCSAQPYILVDNMSPITPQNVSITSTAVTQPITCPGLSNGQATAYATGQYRPFNYVWSTTPPQTDSVLRNVPAGNYTVTVTDANACTATANITITQPSPIVLTSTITHVSCYGFSTGSAYMSYSGGTAPFAFQWNNNVTTQNNTNLVAGTYTVTANDANSCTVSSSIVINQPTALNVAGVTNNPTCTVAGSISVSTTGGSSGYTYLWNTTPVQTAATATNLASGSYNVTVTDAASCSATAGFTLQAPPNPPVVSLIADSVTCFGNSNGSISSTVTGGNQPYTYAWNTVPVQTGAVATNLAAGSYIVTVYDVNLCSATATATVYQPTALSASTTVTNVLCFGGTSGSVTATASGGTMSYTYLWNTTPAQTTATAVNLTSGSYNITITDARGCTVSSGATINQPAAPLVLSETHLDVLCFGDNTGNATVSASGGTAGYTYSWTTTPAQTTATASNLAAGGYIATVTDANSCTASITSTISQPTTAVSVVASVTAPLCFGQPSASATANTNGGVGGYSYLWNTVPPDNNQSISNISAGTYTVTATDANNCIATSSITVAPAPTQLTLSFSHVDVLCYGNATGSVSVNATGSYGGYSYQWNTTPVQTTSTAGQLRAGSYTVTVSDVQGCTAMGSDIISQHFAPLSISTNKVDVLCYGNSTGSAHVVASGGTGTYTYQWTTTPISLRDSISALPAGTYTVTVTDANACTQTASVIINQPAAPLSAVPTVSNVLCNGDSTGSIINAVSGGTPVYTYSWSHNPTLNSSNASNLPAGLYGLNVTDTNGCSLVLSNLLIAEPAVLAATSVVLDESCPNNNDGRIVVGAIGGTLPYTYNWSNGAGNTNILSSLSTGGYDVSVRDANNCSVVLNHQVGVLPGVSFNVQVSNVLCYPLTNGAINITALSPFQPLQYQWSNGATTEDVSSLDVGTYSVVITDANGCSASGVFNIANDNIFSINAYPAVSTIDLGQQVALGVTPSGSALGNVEWVPAVALTCADCASPVSSPVDDITYHITATDVNGCIATEQVRIHVIPKYVVYIPNAFTPNGDGNNDFFEVFGNKEAWKQFAVTIFNRWGEKVYESNDMNFAWDGTYKGELLNPSVYVYMVKVIYLDNYSEKLFKGSVTLIR